MSGWTNYSEGSATISACGRYRYRLTRPADVFGNGTINFVMLNPSKADAKVDDPTIRRCVGFARSLGYANLVVTNLFAFRATDPDELRGRPIDEIVGPDNDAHLVEVAADATHVVCAWGVNGRLHDRGDVVKRMLADACEKVWALKLTKHGDPQHPLYLKADAGLLPYWEEGG